MKPSEYNISAEKFKLTDRKDGIHDKELETKPIGYFQDAFNRFKKNKASIIAAVIIGFLFLFAILGPVMSPYQVKDKDTYYAYALPKLGKGNLPFWDGCNVKEYGETQFIYYYAQGIETNHNAVKNQKYEKKIIKSGNKAGTEVYKFRLDSYNKVGCIYKLLNSDEYKALQDYQDETNIQVIYPITVESKRPESQQDENDANFWYETKVSKGKTVPVLSDANDISSLKNIYKVDSGINPSTGNRWDGYYSIRVEDPSSTQYDYALKKQGDSYQVRINYFEYYIYYHTRIAKDRITYPGYILGATNGGGDIFSQLSNGARFSFALSIVVASVNLVVGAIYGAISGYYGGKVDLIMERITDILGAVPFMIVISLLKYYMKTSPQVLILFISFFLTGWMGMAGTTRMQFYRFKNQEYVLAARTLGASDKRIMFKHVFPNSLGTIVTSCVLVIPSVIFSETSLSYLGIINLDSGNITSVGTLLSNAQPYLVTYPHMILFPALFISLLMLSFNLFGNGLRDAFNPSLRGSED